jgi:hypothetical protein
MAINDEQMNRLIRAIRLIAHGDEEPTGLEMLAMAFSTKDEASVVSTIECLCEQAEYIGDALHRIADNMKGDK